MHPIIQPLGLLFDIIAWAIALRNFNALNGKGDGTLNCCLWDDHNVHWTMPTFECNFLASPSRGRREKDFISVDLGNLS